jgi:hypothetical protein
MHFLKRKYLLFFIITIASSNLFGQSQDSIVTVIAPEYDQVGAVHRYWLGDSYRKLYNTPVKMRVMDLSKEKGGLQVVKLGGGMQTQSLRLVDSNGVEWVLRSIQKFPERSLPESLRKTIAKDIVQDQISIAHPFGALTVPTFNRALDIPHASPELVFVADDPVFGEYQPIFKNRPYMFEARMPFENEKTDNTAKVISRLLDDNDNKVDQKTTLRARLLDFVLGDWDRHEDNWRWDPEKEKGKKIYTPVPRDRDKVYYKTSGIFPVLLSMQWLKAHLQPFSPHIRNVAHWNFNARHFDRFFLNHLSEKDWLEQIEYVQNTLTDSLIRQAMLQMPDTIVKLSAPELEKNIMSRRDELKSTGMEYYKSLAKVVDLPLSGKREFIDVDFENDGSITIDVHNKKKDGTEGARILKRRFLAEDTKEVRIYGIAGEDEYKLHGRGKSLIKLRLIGGKEYDKFSATNAFSNGKRTYLYDSKNKESKIIHNLKDIKYRLKNDSSVHQYQYDNFVYDRKGVLVNLNYGIDRGFIVGAGYLIENQGFRKSPYAYRHEFLASYLTGRGSFIFEYRGNVKKIVGEQDLAIDFKALGPFNQSNFFGYGNNTIYQKGDDLGISYYRNRYDLINTDIFLEYSPIENAKLFYGSSSEFYTSKAKNNDEQFFSKFDQTNPGENIFDHKFFTGATVGLDYDTRDNKSNAKHGMRLFSRLDWKSEINGQNRNYTSLENTISFYKTVFNDRLTFANRTGVQAVWGDPYFYQHAQIGGELSLRGFNSQRFTGKTALYNNLDARLKLFSFSSYLLPGTVGLIGFYDIGRVWMPEERSDQWHMGSGGGIYFMPGDLMTIQATVGVSKEAVLPYIRMGLSF